ncbi:MAG TPA: hypothetical protein VFN80_02145 [Acidothermaceae bacterium]|nr:hypothetical protein [Acidothermaceae bacterium]
MRMQLDGPDLEELLVRARDEYGEDVRIVKADKVRSGGIGGFFTREHYELSIELDDVDGGATADLTSPTLRDERPISLLDLADAISDRELQSRTAHEPQALQNSEPLPFTPGIGPSISTEGASFASILAGLSHTVADSTKAEPPDGRSRQVSAEKAVEVRPTFSPAIQMRAAEPRAQQQRPEQPRSQQRSAKRARPAGRATSSEISVRDLRELGLPRTMLPAREQGDLLSVLVSGLRSLPQPPRLPVGAGSIVAVVGEGESAWDAALQVARSMGLDEKSLAYLTSGGAPAKIAPARRISDLEQLQVRLDRWRKRTTATIVVVDAPMSVRAAAWSRKAIGALGASAVWLVVPATRKTEDVAHWAERLGVIDGLVVTDVDASSDPASVLQLNIPVAWLDGRPATPGAWAGLLVDRLVAAS